MNKKTALENLLFDSGLSHKEFADKVGVKLSTFRAQLRQKKKHIYYAFEYGHKLGVSTISGYTNGVTFDLIFK